MKTISIQIENIPVNAKCHYLQYNCRITKRWRNRKFNYRIPKKVQGDKFIRPGEER